MRADFKVGTMDNSKVYLRGSVDGDVKVTIDWTPAEARKIATMLLLAAGEITDA